MRSFLITLLCVFISGAASARCAKDVVWLRGDFGEARFAIEIADDADERARGLMYRTSMPLSAGMLFVYPNPGRLSFWMRNTLIELDMLFVDPQGVVQSIHHRAQPLDETPISGGDGLSHVLELNGGLAKQMGISTGAQLRHPSFDQGQAAWPC